jgi:CheY-like chemotaxis protein
MRVFTATTTDEVLQIHRAVRVDLIIISLDMPGMSSEQLCSLLRENEKQGAVSIIIVCVDTKRAIEQSARCGANAVFPRPIKPAQLLAQAKTLLNLSWRETYRVILNVSVKGKVTGNHFVCNTLDISLEGMLIETTQIFNMGDPLSCSFFLPDMTQIRITGEIVRTVQPAHGVEANWYGVRFLDLAPDAEMALEAFIDTNAATPPPRHGERYNGRPVNTAPVSELVMICYGQLVIQNTVDILRKTGTGTEIRGDGAKISGTPARKLTSLVPCQPQKPSDLSQALF